MSYCPKCRHEYAETVTTCIDCGTRLRSGNRPVDTSLGIEDTLLPIGAMVCAVIAMVMLALRIGAQNGWLSPALASFVLTIQPPWLTVFYGFVLVSCCVVLLISGIQSLISRR
jgi:hypothetical protein